MSSGTLKDSSGIGCHLPTLPLLPQLPPSELHTATGDGCPCPCPLRAAGPWHGSPSTDTVPVSSSPKLLRAVSTAETPPHPLTSARGPLDPRVSVVLTRGCRHSTPDRPLATLLSFLASVSAAPPRTGQGPGPPCSIVSPPAPPVQPQAANSSSSKKQPPCKAPCAPSRDLAAPAESQDLLCRAGPKPWQVYTDPRSKARSSGSPVPRAAGGNPTRVGRQLLPGRVGIRPSVPSPASLRRQGTPLNPISSIGERHLPSHDHNFL